MFPSKSQRFELTALVQAYDRIGSPSVAVAATVYDTPAENAEPRTDGPIYDLPDNVRQQIVCDRQNREYLLLTTARGGVCLIPYLDEDGRQAIMPNA